MTAYIERINREVVLLPYILGTESKLQKTIYFQESWIEMIQDHTVMILGWIQYEKVKWLQNNNPEVPGLVHKLTPMDEKMRKLNNVRKLWEGILDISEVRDVFTDRPVIARQYDVDHFIPWSFVMNDELWNLMPMDSSLNSAKSNRLPRWEPFFRRFAENQFLMYGLIHEKAGIWKLYEACYRDNLHSLWAGQELYRKGNAKEEFYHILQKNMRPVYDSAKRQGYEVWNRN
ncbi:MAG: HNH endonuclease [Lachnospiraceae bacterium]|nr:HNH endonuclease [Lachnospiraceae bacterium]